MDHLEITEIETRNRTAPIASHRLTCTKKRPFHVATARQQPVEPPDPIKLLFALKSVPFLQYPSYIVFGLSPYSFPSLYTFLDFHLIPFHHIRIALSPYSPYYPAFPWNVIDPYALDVFLRQRVIK